MDQVQRKKSPRAPSMPLDEAIERALRVYDKERRHAAPTAVVAQNLGYSSANNGAALSALASLRSYGLLEKAGEGKLSVSKDVEDYQFAPSEELKAELRSKWLKAPLIFNDLLEKYHDGLPSDATVRYDLIQRGFTPPGAESTLDVFKRSVAFAQIIEQRSRRGATQETNAPESEVQMVDPGDSASPRVRDAASIELAAAAAADCDRIPVRLAGGRRAWLEIPSPFYTADKDRLKAQIDLLLTDDDVAK
jgi:hypothetical protein